MNLYKILVYPIVGAMLDARFYVRCLDMYIALRVNNLIFSV